MLYMLYALQEMAESRSPHNWFLGKGQNQFCHGADSLARVLVLGVPNELISEVTGSSFRATGIGEALI